MRKNLPARGISQCGKSSVQRSRRIFNHLVKYLAGVIATRKHFLQFVEASSRRVVRRITNSQENREL
jgi:hypothetical protein